MESLLFHASYAALFETLNKSLVGVELNETKKALRIAERIFASTEDQPTREKVGRLSEREKEIRDLITIDVIRVMSNPAIEKEYGRRVRKQVVFKAKDPKAAFRIALNRIRAVEGLPASDELRRR